MASPIWSLPGPDRACSTRAGSSTCIGCRSCSAASTQRRGEGPTLYPVACSPQAWAAGGVFLLLQAALGLTIAAPEQRVTITGPRLPECIKWLNVRDLVIGDRTIDLHFERHGTDVHVESVPATQASSSPSSTSGRGVDGARKTRNTGRSAAEDADYADGRPRKTRNTPTVSRGRRGRR